MRCTYGFNPLGKIVVFRVGVSRPNAIGNNNIYEYKQGYNAIVESKEIIGRQSGKNNKKTIDNQQENIRDTMDTNNKEHAWAKYEGIGFFK